MWVSTHQVTVELLHLLRVPAAPQTNHCNDLTRWRSQNNQDSNTQTFPGFHLHNWAESVCRLHQNTLAITYRKRRHSHSIRQRADFNTQIINTASYFLSTIYKYYGHYLQVGPGVKKNAVFNWVAREQLFCILQTVCTLGLKLLTLLLFFCQSVVKECVSNSLQILNIHGAESCPFSDLYFLTWIPVEQLFMQKTKTNLSWKQHI